MSEKKPGFNRRYGNRRQPTPGGRDIRTLAVRSLERYECGWCGQRLDRLKKDPKFCSRIYDGPECDWHEFLNSDPEEDGR